jgi:hypothetical protein
VPAGCWRSWAGRPAARPRPAPGAAAGARHAGRGVAAHRPPGPLSGVSAAAAEAVVQRWARGCRHSGGWPPRSARWPCWPPTPGRSGPRRHRLPGAARPGPRRAPAPGPAAPRRRPGADLRRGRGRVGGRRRGGAAELARAGLDVVVLEKGGYLAERDFSHQEGDAYRDLYLYAMTLTTDDLACRIVAGSALGGGTVVNYTTSFATPPAVLAEWAAVSGRRGVRLRRGRGRLEAVRARLGVTEDREPPRRPRPAAGAGPGAARLARRPLPRNVRGCPQDAGCGWCGFGCRAGPSSRPWSPTWRRRPAAGARLVVGADARRCWSPPAAGRAGRATGVEARTAGGHRLVVRARAVVAAAGAVETPALLLAPASAARSAPPAACTPGTAAMGLFDEPVRWWEGTLQARWSSSCATASGRTRPCSRPCPCTRGCRGRPALAVGRRPPGADAAVGQPVTGRGAVPRHRRRRVRVDRDGSPGSAGGSTPPTRPAWPRASPPPGGAWPPPGPARCSASTASGSPSAPATRPPTGPGPRRRGGPGSAAAGSPSSPTTRWARAASAPTRRPRRRPRPPDP